MARSPILNMVSITVATGTTLNIAADGIHPIGSWGISHISLHQRRPLAELLLFPTWVLQTFLVSKPLTQSVISRYPSDIAIETEI
eukprot:6175102-Pleurochrysis_carterae.AAC.1